MIKKKNILKMIISALFLAISYILPYITGQMREFGSMLCPMHFPILLCGFICGWKWGLAVGFTAPLFRSAIAGMPLFFPTAVCMAFELSAYGALAGFLYKKLPKKTIFIYVSLIVSMLVGRIIWGFSMIIATGIKGDVFGLSAFISGAFTNAFPGIILQIIIIPFVIMAINKLKTFPLKQAGDNL